LASASRWSRAEPPLAIDAGLLAAGSSPAPTCTHVGDESTRVARFHRETVKSFFEVLGAAGLREPGELKPWFVLRTF